MSLREEAAERVEAARSKVEELAREEIRGVALAELREWKAAHPKRSLRLIDAMGVVVLWLDGEATDDIERRDPRLARVVAPLENLRRWVVEQTCAAHVNIDDIEL